jgi:toxin YoeB
VRLVFTRQGWDDYCRWQQSDHSILKRINRLIDDALRDPTSGIGKPEPLKYAITGAWSRRITDEHRLVYRALNDDLVILQARYHHQR